MKRIRATGVALALLLLACLVSLSGCRAGTASGESGLRVHFIDVGQADAILIQSNGENMLIDAGNRADGDLMVAYLKRQGVDALKYVIATHPHEDHIGGMAAVLEAVPADTILLSESDHPTNVFERLLDTIDEQGCRVIQAVVGNRYAIGGASVTILSPNGAHETNVNNTSVGVRLVYGGTAFVMCGDAEKESEADMAASGLTLTADVLKLGHHGSSTSTTDAFLEAVGPGYAVISCGAGNSYGHPHKEILEKLARRQIPYFRTDKQGDVVAESDGTRITWNVEAISSPAQAQSYVLNTNTMKFHKPSCGSVSRISPQHAEETSAPRETLIAMGYSPCGSCKP
ncbi:MAG: ComEC/Rec2 family competence protein [Oscillospiraceae bacterium]